jgi:hypothetical protein
MEERGTSLLVQTPEQAVRKLLLAKFSVLLHAAQAHHLVMTFMLLTSIENVSYVTKTTT